MVQTEFEFTLPIGYRSEGGELYRRGTMRLATANDEIAPLRDARVQANQAYLICILLSRVIEIEGVDHMNPKVIEDLFAADLAYLQEFYNHINRSGAATVHAACPKCATEFDVSLAGVGGS
jgi:hypothetical protein